MLRDSSRFSWTRFLKMETDMSHSRRLIAVALMVAGGLAAARCSSKASSAQPDLKAIVSIKELMETSSIRSPTTFDAVATDATEGHRGDQTHD
jgi:hypothetical protein